MSKVVFLTRLFTPHIGGVETHVLKVAQELQKMGYQIIIVTEQYEEVLNEYEVIKKMEIYRIPHGSVNSKQKLWRWMWMHRIIFEQADYVHVHDVFWWVLPVAPLIRSKYFITFHGWEGKFPVRQTAVLQRKLASKLSMGAIQVGDYIEKWYGTKADVVTYGAAEVAPRTTKDKVRSLLGDLSHGDVSFLTSRNNFKYAAAFVGRLSEDNDIKKVIELFSLWKEKNPKLEFIFIGDGEFKEECEAVGKVTGFIKNVDQYIYDAQIICANSYLAILEAQSIGKLVCSFYSNPLKKDYLMDYPQSEAMIIQETPEEAFEEIQARIKAFKHTKFTLQKAELWAKGQKWDRVAHLYEDLWTKKLMFHAG